MYKLEHIIFQLLVVWTSVGSLLGWQVQIVNSGSRYSESNWKQVWILELESELSFKPGPVLELELEPKSRIGTGSFEKNVFGKKWFKTVGYSDSSQPVSDQVVPKTQTRTISDF